MIVIFSLSAKDAEASTEDSNRVGVMIGRFLYSDFSDWTTEEQLDFAESIEFPVRKGAHALEYPCSVDTCDVNMIAVMNNIS